MQSNKFAGNWWPVTLQPSDELRISEFVQFALGTRPELNTERARQAGRLLDIRMSRSLPEILAHDSLPHLAHVINGWGDSLYQGKRLLDRLLPFAQPGKGGTHFVMQKHAEGDFHPWQTFAYAFMAGISRTRKLGDTKLTLDALARGSTRLEITSDQTEELGHLLFALPWLSRSAWNKTFDLSGEGCSVADLFKMGLESHVSGSFGVCRKFHLTEGLCAVSATIPAFARYRGKAQYFLSGQLDMLLVLAAILMANRGDLSASSDVRATIGSLRKSIVLDHLVENHFYYAGHLFEMAMFAWHFGFKLRREHVHAMYFIANELNSMLSETIGAASFDNSFLHFGHYRRGLTLLLAFAQRRQGSSKFSPAQLRAYTCDFDMIPKRSPLTAIEGSVGIPAGIFDVSREREPVNEHLEAIVKIFNKTAPHELTAVGRFGHFRRVMPANWPRGLHYEFLLEKDYVGTEIHIEDDSSLAARDTLKGLASGLPRYFPDAIIIWDDKWYRGRGRLMLRYAPTLTAREVATRMNKLIKHTFTPLEALANSQAS